MLIHGVRLIAEKLGHVPSSSTHTFATLTTRHGAAPSSNATSIALHYTLSSPALLASLSTDSYLIVDDRSAPMRSEDGVQHGAPLATTSFCVAIHPEVQQCDTTLEVNDGAARFNADDEFLVGLPEHVWPALHAFRTSIKASVGLEVRFDKMQAYSADMEAARREAPADIEWPELDGHHGIAVLNVPLGSPEYVQAYMRGKTEELREEVDASMCKLLSAKPSRRYTHALHHHAWALLKHCMQHKAGYWLRNCLPSEVEAVDATILAAVERVLGVSFDPSTYGTATNPVVTDFLAELLHDPDPMAAEVATLSEDEVARARSRLHLPTRLKGAGIRRMTTVRDAAFIGCMNAILPRFLTRNSGTNTPTPGFFDPQLGSVLGRGSFNATSSARQYDHFLNDAHGSDSYAAEMREAWGRLQAATAGHLGDEDARQMEREVEAASGSQKELTAFLDQANNSRLRNEVCALPATCRERILFNQLDAASGMWTVAIPTARTAMTPHELREVAAGYFLLPSPCLAPVVGSQIILPSTEHNPVTVDLYGDALMNLPAPGDAHWRVQHDAIADAFRDHCVHDLEPSLPAFNVVTGSYDPRSLKSTLLEFKTMRYGVKYTAVPRATAVDRFERSQLGDIQRGLAARDAAWHNTEPGQKGPLRDILDMSEYTGMIFGTVGETDSKKSRGPALHSEVLSSNREAMARRPAPFDDPFFSGGMDPFHHMNRVMNSMFSDPFFGGGMMGGGMMGGPMMGMPGGSLLGGSHHPPAAHRSSRQHHDRPNSVTIEEVDDASGEHAPRHGRRSRPQEPVVEEPDDTPHHPPGGSHRASRRSAGASTRRPPSEAHPGRLMGASLGGAGPGTCFSYSSTSYSSGGPGGAVYSSTTTSRRGANGVSETTRQEFDGRTGEETLEIARGMGDKSRTITRKRDGSGQEQVYENLNNLGREEATRFDQDWMSRAGTLPGGGARTSRRSYADTHPSGQYLEYGGTNQRSRYV
eukprot:jgi/Tetstr1/420440/TSEL_011553.t1